MKRFKNSQRGALILDFTIGTVMAGMAAVVFAGLLGAALRHSGMTEETSSVPVVRSSLTGTFIQASVNEGRAFIQAAKLWGMLMQDVQEAAYFLPAPFGGHPVAAGADWNGSVFPLDPEGFRQMVRGWTDFPSAWASAVSTSGLFEYSATNSGLTTSQITSLLLLKRDGSVLGILRTFDYSNSSAYYAVEYCRPGGSPMTYQVQMQTPLSSFGVAYADSVVHLNLPNPRALPGVESKQFSTILPLWR